MGWGNHKSNSKIHAISAPMMRQTWVWRAGSGGELGWQGGAQGTRKESGLHCKKIGWDGSSCRAELCALVARPHLHADH